MPEETQVLELLYSSEAIASPPPHVSPGELFDACLNYAEAVLGGPVTVSYHPDHSTPYIRMTRREDAV